MLVDDDVESIYQELRRLSEVTFLSLSASTETVATIYFLQAVDSLKSSTLWIPQPQIGQNTLNFPTDAITWSVIANRCIQGHEHEADVIFCILYSEPSESYCHVEKLYR